MDSCWNKNADSRPGFNSLYGQLSDYINDINDTDEKVVSVFTPVSFLRTGEFCLHSAHL